MSTIQHLKVTISGKVQGVRYRASTKEAAQKIGVNGFVKNQPNGTVYAEFEGSEDQLTAILEWCKKGPPLARVTTIEKKEGAVEGFEEFTVR